MAGCLRTWGCFSPRRAPLGLGLVDVPVLTAVHTREGLQAPARAGGGGLDQREFTGASRAPRCCRLDIESREQNGPLRGLTIGPLVGAPM